MLNSEDQIFWYLEAHSVKKEEVKKHETVWKES